MKHIKDFQSLVAAKAATLYSPLVVNVTDSGTSKMLIKDAGNTEMKISSDVQTIDDLTDDKIIEKWDYLTFTCTRAGGISMSHYGTNVNTTKPSLQYSIDGGTTWMTWDGTNISVTSGNTIKLKGDNPNGISSSNANYSQFVMTGSFAASGNIMSLIDGQKNGTKVIPCDYCFFRLFAGCFYGLTVAPELPATTLANYCYFYMFYNCNNLITAPELPATTLAEGCYCYMFRYCANLTTVPELHATTLADYCYYGMFDGCTSLTTTPALPVTTLANYCYAHMFSFCTSLTTAPALPATALKDYCYYGMFCGCTSLAAAPVLPATTLAEGCYCYMFYDCTNLITVSELPATTLADYCYYQMFYNCTSLQSAPELPATTLITECYQDMFYGCSNLSYIKCLATDISANYCTSGWVSSVSASGTFVKNPAMSSWPTGENGIPSGWTVQDA